MRCILLFMFALCVHALDHTYVAASHVAVPAGLVWDSFYYVPDNPPGWQLVSTGGTFQYQELNATESRAGQVFLNMGGSSGARTYTLTTVGVRKFWLKTSGVWGSVVDESGISSAFSATIVPLLNGYMTYLNLASLAHSLQNFHLFLDGYTPIVGPNTPGTAISDPGRIGSDAPPGANPGDSDDDADGIINRDDPEPLGPGGSSLPDYPFRTNTGLEEYTETTDTTTDPPTKQVTVKDGVRQLENGGFTATAIRTNYTLVNGVWTVDGSPLVVPMARHGSGLPIPTGLPGHYEYTPLWVPIVNIPGTYNDQDYTSYNDAYESFPVYVPPLTPANQAQDLNALQATGTQMGYGPMINWTQQERAQVESQRQGIIDYYQNGPRGGTGVAPPSVDYARDQNQMQVDQLNAIATNAQTVTRQNIQIISDLRAIQDGSARQTQGIDRVNNSINNGNQAGRANDNRNTDSIVNAINQVRGAVETYSGGGGGFGVPGNESQDFASGDIMDGADVDGVVTTLAPISTDWASVSGGTGGLTYTFAIPWVGGGTQEFTISSTPETGSALDGIRIFLKALGLLACCWQFIKHTWLLLKV